MAVLALAWTPMRAAPQTWFFLRREPLYHKLQYSKVPKYDSSAAILGTVLGAFAGYLALASVGSAGTDLTDLTALVMWALLGLGALALSLEPRNHHTFVVLPPLALWTAPFGALGAVMRRALRAARAPLSRVLPARVFAWGDNLVTLVVQGPLALASWAWRSLTELGRWGR